MSCLVEERERIRQTTKELYTFCPERVIGIPDFERLEFGGRHLRQTPTLNFGNRAGFRPVTPPLYTRIRVQTLRRYLLGRRKG